MNLDTHKLTSDYSYKFSFSIDEILQDWLSVLHNNTYLSSKYLKALENSDLSLSRFVYVVVFHKQIPVGVFYYQCLEIKNENILNYNLSSNVKKILNQNIIKNVTGTLMLCGNFFATGANGFFINSNVPENTIIDISEAVKEKLKTNKKPLNVKLMMLKEFSNLEFDSFHNTIANIFVPFEIDVNMVLHMKKDWNSFQDYLGDMTTKYRTRAKRVLKQTNFLEKKQFDLKDIEFYKKQINELYLSVVNNADFNLATFSEHSFYQFKKELGHNFLFTGYFMDEKLVAFGTGCFTNKFLDANYVGINYDINKQAPIYQRVLYDYVEVAIEHNVRELRFGRTAEIMKSNLGAVPVGMKLYIKHNNKLINSIIKPIVRLIKPNEFEIRKPFKVG